MKVALCAIVRNENLYIREWVEYYKNIGIAKIFIYDNNTIDGEHLEDVIDDYIKSGFIEIIDVRGDEMGNVYIDGLNLQIKCYIDCYKSKVSDFDWVCFFDVDEFISFKKGWDLFSFLNQDIFNDKDTILINWVIYDDNNLIHYDDRPVRERFTHVSKNQPNLVKSIVRTNKQIFDEHLNHLHHSFRLNGNLCLVDGTVIKYNPWNNNWYSIPYPIANNSICVLNHYKIKSLEEYIKRNLGRHFGKKPYDFIYNINSCITDFFLYCEKTPEKIEYIKSLGFDNLVI